MDITAKQFPESLYSSIALAYILFIILVYVLGGSAIAATHYVRSDAAGRNDGSDWSNAYTQLPDILIRGDTYFIADGSYGNYRFDDTTSGDAYIHIKKATNNNSEVTSVAGWENGYGDGQAVFRAPGERSIIEMYSSNILFSGVKGYGDGSQEPHGFRIEDQDCSEEAAFPAYRASNLLTFGTYQVSNITLSNIEFINCGQGNNWYCNAGNNAGDSCNPGADHFNDAHKIQDHIDSSSQCLPLGDGFASTCRPEWYNLGMVAVHTSGLPHSAPMSENITIESNKFIGSSTHITARHWNNSKISNNYFGYDWGWSNGSHNQQIAPTNADNIELSGNTFADTGTYIIGAHATGCTYLTSNIEAERLRISNVINDRTLQVVGPTGPISWSVDQWKDLHVRIYFGSSNFSYTIASNTSDTITITMPWLSSDGADVNDTVAILDCWRSSDDWNVFNNIVLASPYPFAGFGSADANYQDVIKRWNVHHNTIIGAELGGYGFIPTGRITDPVSNRSQAFNNLFVEVVRPDVDAQNDSMFAQTGTVEHDFNAFYSCTGEIETEANIEINNTLTIQDVFIDAPNGDFRLRIPTNNGNTLSPPFNIDKNGLSRGIDGIWDKGANEFILGAKPPAAPSNLTIVE